MTVPQRATRAPQESFPSGVRCGDGVMTLQWFVAKPKDPAISGFSALGYYLGVQLHEKLGVPIGLVDTSWGGTIASAWCSREALDAIPEAAGMMKAKDAAADAWSEEGARKELETAVADWEKAAAAAKAENKRPPGKPMLRTDPAQDRNFPAAPFNAMIWPLRQMTVRGVFFYQGENNLFDKTDPFTRTFPAVVISWREAFGEPQLPFCLFQICGWGDTNHRRLYNQDHMIPVLQEQQHKAQLALPNTGFVVTGDYPHGDIHPMVKRPIAERAVRWARAEVYGEKGVTWGTPVYQCMKKVGNRLILNFRTPGNEALNLRGEPAGFVIAGADGKFVEAQAEVVGRTSVAAWSDKVADPVTVRFNWSDIAFFHLYTESGLPVGVFRTDDFPTSSAHM
jgi:sialate O-acetylesterase